jgi:hypothetical protein
VRPAAISATVLTLLLLATAAAAQIASPTGNLHGLALDSHGTLSRLETFTGRRQPIEEFRPGSTVVPSADGASCVWAYGRDFSHLILIDGLR